MTSRFLVLDIGTTGLRAAIVDDRLRIEHLEYRENPPSTPFEGLVEFDAVHLAELTLEAARAALDRAPGPVAAIGITTQRASTVVWDRTTGAPVGPGIGWQDLRTITECIVAKAEHDWTIAPNQSITKLAWLLQNTPDLDGRDLCFGTIDSWIAWTLTAGEIHVSDGTNMSTTTTGMRVADGSTWAPDRLDHFGIDPALLPTVVDSAGVVGHATELPGGPPIAALCGDQQASLIGQACIRPGLAKLTLGTGGMLDLVTGTTPPTEIRRNDAGTYALPTWQLDGDLTWGAEGIMLSAGTNVEWLRDDLSLIATSADSHDVAQRCASSDGVVYVPALLGLGTPRWDYGARGTLLGITRGTERPHIVRAVLEGVAHRCADLVEAATADTGVEIDTIRLDGGMSPNPTLVQALADATGTDIEVSPTTEATTRGAAFLAGLGIGAFSRLGDVAELWDPATSVQPDPSFDRAASRSRWHDALERAGEWYPDLSALDF
ncbi:FGGY family carbohydrate kinase [Ilumatobacter nonamiensis]|uniref:FGGY family carbohydrate kinase n=1 Tax=Ilumatobacter nonamiensis TaxID=467093 RepID=UPI00034CA6F1|nr:FGGY-family carbohydrate kinase [Ilumatobacter nonamiensis]